MDHSHKVVLYYAYVDIPDPEDTRQWQTAMCEELQLLGRVRVAREGINGTLGGTNAAIDTYIARMQAHPLFKDVDYKTSSSSIGAAFPSLRVVVSKEVVSLAADPRELEKAGTATHVSPERFADMIRDNDPNTVLLDCRNEYEAKIGRFRGAKVPRMRNFTEFPRLAKSLVEEEDLKGKRVLMYCTGGVRCERGSAVVRSLGVEDVYQLQGGIHRFLEQFPDGGGLFVGKNFVFDERVAIPPEQGATPCGRCDTCGTEYDDYSPKRRCSQCRVLVLVCDDCEEAQGGVHTCDRCASSSPR